MRGLRLELARLLGWKRWLAAGAVFAGAGLGGADQLVAEVGRRNVNQWDVILWVLNQPIIVVYVLTLVFVAMVGDISVGDRGAAFASLALPRAGSRTRWWAWKLSALIVAGMVYALFAAGVVGVVGAALTHAGWGFSTHARGLDPAALGGGEVPPLLPPSSLPILGIAVVASYTGLAIGSLGAVVVATAQIWPRPWTPLLLATIVGLLFFRVRPTNMFHPLIHLLWNYHSLRSGFGLAVHWWASGLFILTELAGAFLIGRAVLGRADL